MSRTQDVMQDYFAELLRERELEARVAGPPPQAKLAAAQTRAQLRETRAQELEREALEALQKQKLQALLDQQTKISTETVDVSSKTIEQHPPLEQSEVDEPELEVAEIEVPELLRWHANGRPLWAQEEFDVLLFEVSGLTLAVPLIALGQIQQLSDELTPIFGQSDWFMGLLPGPNGNLKTVNTALFVMPEKYNEKFLETARFVISIDGLNWGLAVDKVNQPSRIRPDEVKWRTDRSKRPWLAGTVKSAMCALIDIPQMGRILSASEK